MTALRRTATTIWAGVTLVRVVANMRDGNKSARHGRPSCQAPLGVRRVTYALRVDVATPGKVAAFSAGHQSSGSASVGVCTGLRVRTVTFSTAIPGLWSRVLPII
jgi:hypothetical protein